MIGGSRGALPDDADCWWRIKALLQTQTRTHVGGHVMMQVLKDAVPGNETFIYLHDASCIRIAIRMELHGSVHGGCTSVPVGMRIHGFAATE